MAQPDRLGPQRIAAVADYLSRNGYRTATNVSLRGRSGAAQTHESLELSGAQAQGNRRLVALAEHRAQQSRHLVEVRRPANRGLQFHWCGCLSHALRFFFEYRGW